MTPYNIYEKLTMLRTVFDSPPFRLAVSGDRT